MNSMKKFLIDLDGVIYQGDTIINGANTTLKFLDKHGYDFVLVTNTTRMPKNDLIQKLRKFNIIIDENRLVTALSATVDYLKFKNKNAKCYLIAPDDCDADFKDTGITITRKEEPVDFVVVGYDPRINFEMLNSAFRLIQDGAEFIAMHEDKILPGNQKNSLGLGAFVKGLEYSTDKKPTFIGKPNKNFFEIGMQKISAAPNETVMVGDSLIGDIIGATNAGLKTMMVKTGNYNEKELQESLIKPDFIIDSIEKLPGLLSDYPK
jgi:phospholysine phosphohistidine inorganic pyrophosphate phosphatase